MAREKGLTSAVEDYLKTIYKLTNDKDTTSTSEIAENLTISPASVTNMLQKLAIYDPPLVNYHKSRGVSLTQEGKQSALRKIRQHRLVELFLVEILGYSWDEIHEEAEILEHVISPKLEERISKILGDPKFDPHGDPIPDMSLMIHKSNAIPLAQLKTGQNAKVSQVKSSDAGLLRYLGEMGVMPGTMVSLTSVIPYDRTLHICIDDKVERVFGEELGQIIMVDVAG